MGNLTAIRLRNLKEPDTLTYQWLVSADRTTAHIMERYRMPGLLPCRHPLPALRLPAGRALRINCAAVLWAGPSATG